ncbi:MAG: hypothetical protein H6634_12450 [Anaerolineales bacterium]|nr:hypothetical protein [Anaerolineales bacterium]
MTDKKLTQIDVGDIVCNANHSWAETNYLEIKYQSDENITTVQIDDCEPIFFSNIGGFKDFLYITSYDLTGLDLYYFLLSGFK